MSLRACSAPLPLRNKILSWVGFFFFGLALMPQCLFLISVLFGTC